MAPTPTIPSATSVVDYLNTKGQDSSFSARKKLYNDYGFGDRLGDFVGGANQNLALLRELQKADTAPKSPEPPAPTPVTGNTQAPAFNLTKSITSPTSFQNQTSTPMTSSDLLKSVGFMDIPAPKPAPTGAVTGKDLPSAVANLNQLTGQKLGGATETPKAPSIPATTAPGMATPQNVQQVDTQTQQATGLSASTLYPDIFGEQPDLSEADYVNRWLNSPEGQIFLDRRELKEMTDEAKAQTLKQELEAKFKSDRESLEEKLAANGLAFSGIRGTKVKALADSLAASLLEVDRDMATKLLDADIDLREAILDGVADLAKDAKDGRKEAIQQLNAIGYAVVGDQLVPTLSALSGERAQRSLELSERRLQLAEESAARAEGGNKLTLSEVQSRGLPLYLVGQSEQTIANSFYSPTPPAWFVKKVEDDNKQSVIPEVVQKLWNEQAPKYISGTTESTNAGKARSYFTSAYGGALNEEQVKTLVDRVELYINGGDSYADAIQKVIKEATK